MTLSSSLFDSFNIRVISEVATESRLDILKRCTGRPVGTPMDEAMSIRFVRSYGTRERQSPSGPEAEDGPVPLRIWENSMLFLGYKIESRLDIPKRCTCRPVGTSTDEDVSSLGWYQHV